MPKSTSLSVSAHSVALFSVKEPDCLVRQCLGPADPNKHIVGIASTPDGKGYWLVAADGGVFSFGDAKFFGSLGAVRGAHIVGMVADANLGYRLITAQGNAVPFGVTPTG